MKIRDTSIPVVILNCKLGALSIMRSLGSLGVPMYGVDNDPRSPGMLSRYCRERFQMDLDEDNPQKLADYLLSISERIGQRCILIPTSDETAVFVAEYGDQLGQKFLFSRNDPQMINRLMNKRGMYELAKLYEIPTPLTEFPQNLDDLMAYAERATYPVMLKGVLGNRLVARTSMKMVLAYSEEELIANYKLLEDMNSPNLMLQEYIPGDDDQVYIFNGYFGKDSECLTSFTGHKIRQFPVHVGCASLGACTWNQEVADLTVRFMQAVDYRGILDIGYRLDPRDGQYKVLDANPRIGQAFRMFVDDDDMDVARAQYLDLTGQEVPSAVRREGRRWLIEDFDLVSSIHYYQEGSLSVGDWLRSFGRVEEALWFNWSDPFPFIHMSVGLLRKSFRWLWKKIGFAKNPSLGRAG